MPRPIGSTAPTRLARIRLQREITQRDLARAVGVSFRTYRRLEAGEVGDPSIRVLTNLAIALGVELEELLEPEWRRWSVFNGEAAKPPERDLLWLSARLDAGARKRTFSAKAKRGAGGNPS
jgi:transcriptional regulator with XRE-family HTH domain